MAERVHTEGTADSDRSWLLGLALVRRELRQTQPLLVERFSGDNGEFGDEGHRLF